MKVLEETGMMSSMHKTAYHTLAVVHKVVGKPDYTAKKLRLTEGEEIDRRAWGGTTMKVLHHKQDVGWLVGLL